jgi:tetratricopeptide (TPR) repeat protein
VAQRGGVGRSETLEAPFVGRDEELRQLKELFHATGREGRPRLVSVIGPAGIGKSRLAWEFLKYVDGLVEGVWWHEGRCPAYGEGISFWALGEMIRSRARLPEDADEAATRAAIAAMLAEHVPDEAERAWIEPALLSLLGLESGVGSQQLLGAWRTFFERLADTGPVVMVFEDLHYADTGLLDFIDHIQEWSRTAPILIVTLARPELLERRADWGAGKRSFTSIHLEPLPEAAMRELLGGLVPGLPTAARDAIVVRADGIPLYAVETVRMLLAQGRLVLADGVYRPADSLSELAVPETLTALISARLDELDPADRALVADAAVLGQTFTLAGLAAVAGTDALALEPRLRALVRRELLVQQVDPRSPERGQYSFVQALIREVAYNTLAKRDRKVRHLAAARFFESLGSDELAGALAGHYLAAHGYAAEGSEADALAAQARLALRGAAERAVALGSHGQAIAFLEHALRVSLEPADRADLHERALASAMEGLVLVVAERHALGAVEARRALGDREGVARAIAAHAHVISSFNPGDERVLELVLPAWEEFADLESTPAGVALMLEMARGRLASDDAAAIGWLERALVVAERLDLLAETAAGLTRLSSSLLRLGRPREGLILLRGAHELAVTNRIDTVERTTRTILTFLEQFADPVAGLAMAREGLEIAARRGSAALGFQMVGNAVSCAIRTGEWAWASALLDEWLGNEITGEFYLELYVDRAVLTSLRGGDASADLAEAERLLPTTKDPQYASYCSWARAWQAFVGGRLDDARRESLAAFETTIYFRSITLPIAARAALWSGDAAGATDILAQMEAPGGVRGQAIELDGVTLRAGIAALEGRRGDAIAGYREALRGWHELGLAFDEALAALDMALLLAPAGTEMPESGAAIDAARVILERIGAEPFLVRLEAALAAGQPVTA